MIRRRIASAAALVAATLVAAALASCASPPSSRAPSPEGRTQSASIEAAASVEASASAKPESAPAPATEASAIAPSSVAAASSPLVERPRLSPPKERVPYLDAALSDYWREVLPNGVTVAVKRQEGRQTAAARIALERSPLPEKPQEAGYDALALYAAVLSPAGAAPGSVALASASAGGALELKLEDYDDVALELTCPTEAARSLLGLAAKALAAPGFAEADFARALRDARLEERREAGDPLVRTAAELRAALYKGHPYGQSPRGTLESLAAATRDSVMRYWSSRFDPGRLTVVAVGDFEPREFAAFLRDSFGAIASGPGAARRGVPVAELPIRPYFKAVPLSATPGSAVLRGEFAAPPAGSPDAPAMTLALAMLDDLLLARLRGERAIAYGAWSRLSAAAASSASVTIYKTGDPAAAKAAVDAAIADLSRGLCLDVLSADGRLGPMERSLEAYKARATTAAYARGASSAGMAARIARDIASGGDGTALFRIAERIAEVSAEDVARVARERLRDGPSAWVALGDPALVLGLSRSDFAPTP